MRFTLLRRTALASAVSLAAVAAPAVLAQGAIEEVVVTGSYIRGTPQDAALPVDVITRQDLEDVGNPSLIEMVRNLGITSGNLGETNQFQTGGQGNEGVTTINLRGLGGSRTLVLLNGRRHVATETQGVDISALPSAAVGRIEILKDGAAALYGSDAIAGVVNMITRSGFEGLELRASNQFIDDSDGDLDVNALYGWANDSMNVMVAAEWQRRGELQIKDRNWALRPRDENPNGGWSNIGNPSQILAVGPTGGFIAAGRDPRCTDLGGAVSGAANCAFQYTYFDNLIEEQDTYKLYSEFNWDISDAATLHIEALYSKMDMPEWLTSPSYPPQSLFGPDRFVAASHPGLRSFQELYPERLPAGTTGAFLVSRMIGVAGLDGGPQTGKRETETMRLGASLSGSLFDSTLDYSAGITWSQRERKLRGADMYVERMAFALDGLGGPNCNPATGTPGQGGCLYYNPFSNAIQRSTVNGFVNPDFPANGIVTFDGLDYQIGNPRELLDWMVDPSGSDTKNDLLVWDLVFSGQMPWTLPGGSVGWALGGQARLEKYDLTAIENSDLTRVPCAFNDPTSVALGNVTQANFDACQNNPEIGTGPYAFLAGTVPNNTSRTIYGFFGELALPISDTVDMQVALRFEDYGDNVGSTIDPKIALRWQANDWLAFRGSASTTFRGPPQSFLSSRGTSLQFIAPANAFKAVDTLGNPNLGPESATAINLGVIVDYGNFYGSLDFWSFDFSDPFQTESAAQIVSAYQAFACQDGGAGAASPECQILRTHVLPTGTTAAGLERVEVNFINGADQDTSGIDLFAQYDFDDVFGGTLALGLEGTYTFDYKSDDFKDINGLTLARGQDFVGFLNTGFAPLTPKPELKGRLFAKYSIGNHRINYVLNYVDEYKDARASETFGITGNPVAPTVLPELGRIDEHVTHDLHWIWSLMDENLVLSLSALNLTDEDPPMVALDQNYDPFTHNAFGRMIKAGVTYRMGGGR